MKKIVMFFLFLFPLLGLAQSSTHMKFLGIPINGPVRQFGNQLTERGFEWISFSGPLYMMQGVLAGHPGMLYIRDGDDYGIGVYQVNFKYVVVSSYGDEIEQGDKDLEELKQLLSRNYTLKTTNKVDYSTWYSFSNSLGVVVLGSFVQKGNAGGWFYKIEITYTDKKNSNLLEIRQKSSLGKNSDL